jgi:hypothetical protein
VFLSLPPIATLTVLLTSRIATSTVVLASGTIASAVLLAVTVAFLVSGDAPGRSGHLPHRLGDRIRVPRRPVIP